MGRFTEFDVEFKFAKIQNSHLWGVGAGGSQNLMLSSNLLKSKIPISAGVGGWEDSQNLMLSSNLLKSKIPICGGMGGVGGVREFMEFDVEFKFAKIQNSHLRGWGWEGVGRFVEFDVEFKFAKIQNSHLWGGGGWGFTEFDIEFKFAKIKNSHLWRGGGCGGIHGI